MEDSRETTMCEDIMNAGYAEGYKDGVNTKIESLHIQPGDMIIIELSSDYYQHSDVSNITKIADIIKSKYPENTLIITTKPNMRIYKHGNVEVEYE